MVGHDYDYLPDWKPYYRLKKFIKLLSAGSAAVGRTCAARAIASKSIRHSFHSSREGVKGRKNSSGIVMASGARGSLVCLA